MSPVSDLIETIWEEGSGEDGSVDPVYMGPGFTWMDRTLKICDSERIGREEEGTSSGIMDLGGYVVILKCGLVPSRQSMDRSGF